MKGQGILLDIVRLQLKLVQPFHFQGCYFQRKWNLYVKLFWSMEDTESFLTENCANKSST